MKWTKRSVGVAAGGALALALAVSASALWSAQASADGSSFERGSVRASIELDGETAEEPATSIDGAPVELEIPAATMQEALDAPGSLHPPGVLSFTVKGTALGIAGLDYGITAVEAVPGTTIRIERADEDGTCGPVAPSGRSEPSVNVIDGENVTLQAPGAVALDTPETANRWCVSIERLAEGTGTYRGSGIAESSIGETLYWADDEWRAETFDGSLPDRSLTVRLTPIVTNLNPSWSRAG